MSTHVGRIFLSHTSTDKLFVSRLASDLRVRGIGVWYDDWEMRVGDSLVERIQEGIQESGFLAVVLSPRSVQSGWVRRELNAALAEELQRKGVFVLPILFEDCEIPLFLRDKLYADFRYQYSNGFDAILRTVAPGGCTPPKLLFDSQLHDPEFATWAVHCSDGATKADRRLSKDDTGHVGIVICASGLQSVGLNKSVPSLHGRVEFEYRVEATEAGAHIYFAMIPVQETGYHRRGVIEVGSDRAGDPRNVVSPLRIRFEVPVDHQINAEWHIGVLDFDFRDTPTAFYAIFAARINEGSSQPKAGCLGVGRVRVYSW
jgi:hypothetical protein